MCNTIKEVKKELRYWGWFWAAKRGLSSNIQGTTQHYIDSKKAATLGRRRTVKAVADRSNRVKGLRLPVECQAKERHTHTSDTSDNIHVPIHIDRLDAIIERLSRDCQRALVRKYILQVDAEPYWQNTAERLVMQAWSIEYT